MPPTRSRARTCSRSSSYLDMMKRAARQGRRPERAARRRRSGTRSYNFDLSGVDESGATPFWRAPMRATRGDEAAGRARRRPDIPTMQAGRTRPRIGDDDRETREDVAACRRCRSAARACRRCTPRPASGYGDGFAANSHHFAPTGMLAAVKYLVEELGADVNAVDARRQHGGAPRRRARRQRDDPLPGLEGRGRRRSSTAPARRPWTWPTARCSASSRIPRRSRCSRGLGAMNNHKCVSC